MRLNRCASPALNHGWLKKKKKKCKCRIKMKESSNVSQLKKTEAGSFFGEFLQNLPYTLKYDLKPFSVISVTHVQPLWRCAFRVLSNLI